MSESRADAPVRPSALKLWGIDRPADSTDRVRGFGTYRSLGDMKEASARRAAFKAAGLEDRPIFQLRQVHGTEIVAVRDGVPPPVAPEADGWITSLAGPVLCVYVADCLPLFLWEKSGKAVGIFHAGWRGLAKGMPRKAVEAFVKNFAVDPEDLTAVIGPHIMKCCYRVGPETAAQFRPESLSRMGDDTFLDLRQEAAWQLGESGVNSIVLQGCCTSCEKDLYFSFRREKAGHRMMAFITLDSEQALG